MRSKVFFARRSRLWAFLFSLIFITACSTSDAKTPVANSRVPTPSVAINNAPDSTLPENGSITVFAAASLTDAFREIGMDFEKANPGIKVRFSFAGTQVLRTQIEQGALVDCFASADQENMDLLINESLIEARSERIFASNRLIVILPEENHGGIEGLKDLAKPGIKLVLADLLVPAGIYTRQVISKISENPEYGVDFSDKVLKNVVSNETDVRQVVTKVELGEADAGIVYASDAIAARQIKSIEIPEEFNIVAQYPIGVLSGAQHPEIARSFMDFVTSPSGQGTLKKWGFMPGW